MTRARNLTISSSIIRRSRLACDRRENSSRPLETTYSNIWLNKKPVQWLGEVYSAELELHHKTHAQVADHISQVVLILARCMWPEISHRSVAYLSCIFILNKTHNPLNKVLITKYVKLELGQNGDFFWQLKFFHFFNPKCYTGCRNDGLFLEICHRARAKLHLIVVDQSFSRRIDPRPRSGVEQLVGTMLIWWRWVILCGELSGGWRVLGRVWQCVLFTPV